MISVIDKLTITFALSAYTENSVDCANIKDCQFEDPSTDKKLSINTLMEEVMPIIIEIWNIGMCQN